MQGPTNRRPSSARPVEKKTKHWLDAVVTSADRIRSTTGAPGITFLEDREGDSAAMLSTLVGTGIASLSCGVLAGHLSVRRRVGSLHDESDEDGA